MRISAMVIACSAMLAIVGASQPALSQQKTAKACRDEWRANKEANQAKGITEKAYVAQCREGNAAAQPTAAPTAAPAPAPAPAPTPAAAPARPAPAPARPATAGTPTGANQFANEAQAKGHCPSDTVVWVNLTSNIYHYAGSKSYGTTKKGAYMCERDTASQGARAAKNEKHPS